ncbi:MAG: efflux RND transporter periplasmic adaptor subunit [Longimicrobiales bacterium]
MRFRKQFIGFGVLALIVAALAIGIYARIGEQDEASGDTLGADAAALPDVSAADAFSTDQPIPVEGAVVVRDTLILRVRAEGQAAAWRQTAILAQVEGQVRTVRVRENSRVGEGTLMVTVDSTEYALAADEARAHLRQAQAQYRELTLFDENIEDAAVRREREQASRAKSGLDAAEVAVRRAELDLLRTRVTSPFSGRVANMRIVAGQRVRAGDELLTVADLDPIRVEVQVLESEIGFLRAGRTARVSFAAFPGEAFEGRIETINPIVDATTRTAKVTVSVPNPEGRILPGFYAVVSLDARRFADRILVPRAAILERDRRAMLFVYDAEQGARAGRAKWRYVTTGLENGELVEIVENPETEMVQPGEVVLVAGHYTLTHDAPVRVTDNASAEGGRPN